MGVLDCAGRAQRRQRFRAAWERCCGWFKSGVALRFPPQSKIFADVRCGQNNAVGSSGDRTFGCKNLGCAAAQPYLFGRVELLLRPLFFKNEPGDLGCHQEDNWK